MSLSAFEHNIDRGLAVVKTNYQPLIVWLLLTCLSFQNLTADPDLFARVAIGRLIEALPEFPLSDPFSFTETKGVWVSHEWISGMVFYFLSQLRGDFSLFVFKSLLMLGSLTLLYRARKTLWGTGPGDFFWLLFAGAASHYIWASTIRSQEFTYLFIPLLFWAFAAFEKERRKWHLLLATAVMPFWSGAHGGFVVGLGFWAFFWFSKLFGKPRELLVVSLFFILALAGSAVSPYGTAVYWSFILDAVFKSRPSITEWASVGLFSAQAFAPSVFIVAMLAGGWQLYKKHRLEWKKILLSRWIFPALVLGSSLVQGLKHERLSAIFFMSAAVYAAPLLRLFHESIRNRFSALYIKSSRAAFLLGAASSVYAVFIWTNTLLFPARFSLSYAGYPVAAIEWLRSQGGLGGRLLVDFNNGSYAFWRGYPAIQTSLDGRYEEVFPDATVEKVAAALDTRSLGQQAALAWINPSVILLSKTSSAFAEREKFGAEWLLVYEDDAFALLSRHLSENRPVITVPVWEPLF